MSGLGSDALPPHLPRNPNLVAASLGRRKGSHQRVGLVPVEILGGRLRPPPTPPSRISFVIQPHTRHTLDPFPNVLIRSSLVLACLVSGFGKRAKLRTVCTAPKLRSAASEEWSERRRGVKVSERLHGRVSGAVAEARPRELS